MAVVGLNEQFLEITLIMPLGNDSCFCVNVKSSLSTGWKGGVCSLAAFVLFLADSVLVENSWQTYCFCLGCNVILGSTTYSPDETSDILSSLQYSINEGCYVILIL